MSDWVLSGTETFIGVGNIVDLSFSLSSNIIIIDIDSPLKKPTWQKAGDIIQLIDISIPLLSTNLIEVSDSYSYVGFNPTLIKFQVLSGNIYKLRFKAVPWLTNFSISIWYYGT